MIDFSASMLLDHLTPDAIADVIEDLYFHDPGPLADQLIDIAWRALNRNCGTDAIGYMTARNIDYADLLIEG